MPLPLMDVDSCGIAFYTMMKLLPIFHNLSYSIKRMQSTGTTVRVATEI